MQHFDNEIYHIYNRGVRKSPIFFNKGNYQYCLELIKKYAETYDVTVIAYCLMPNHYHFVLQQKEGGTISKFLQTTFNAYTQAINKQQALSGTLFQGRAKTKQIESDSYVMGVIRYIHLNPVMARLTTKPEEWEFSDYHKWIGTQSDSLTHLSLRDRFFRDGKDYRLFVEVQGEKDKQGIQQYLFEE
ncbi:MAG: transposase [Ignavibacteriales bacterium]|nr:transposase [Ignavibacteriales bacterium]MBI3787846.1 transposase [Ignavibacteriales bacterium]